MIETTSQITARHIDDTFDVNVKGQRMGDPAEVGAAAAFLAASDSSLMTGSEVAVDGGLAQI